jgi:hypothetical protein
MRAGVEDPRDVSALVSVVDTWWTDIGSHPHVTIASTNKSTSGSVVVGDRAAPGSVVIGDKIESALKLAPMSRPALAL